MKIPVSHGHLEAHLRTAEGERRAAAVFCHPHPLHGGTMHTKAVFRAAQALSEIGVDVLRFNFRGVGLSTGSYDEGIGEMDDARAALDWLEGHALGLPLILGGFSFGSRVALSVGVKDKRVAAMLALGVAPDLFDYDFLDGVTAPILVVQGEDDEFGSGAEAERVMKGLSASITVVRVPNAGHYFHDHFDELKTAIMDYFSEGAGVKVLGAPADSVTGVEG